MPENLAATPRTATRCRSSLGREVWVQNAQLLPFIEKAWIPDSLSQLTSLLKDTLRIPLTDRGLVQASNRSDAMDPTNYDAVWVRDSMWVYHALAHSGSSTDARRVLDGMLGYFASPAQGARLARVIASPELTQGPAGAMEVLHIRFDGKSPTLDDVQTHGEPQYWNHKQNDALGIFYSAVADSLSRSWTAPSEISPAAWTFLLRLPTYLEAVCFYDMPDAGAWEEIERINTSSIALCTDALEKWQALRTRSDVRSALQQAAHDLGVPLENQVLFDDHRLEKLIQQGYRRLHSQLPYESPLHPQDTLLFRKADAALLNLLYPCSLKGIDIESKLQVLSTVETLAGERGIRRYYNDAYQSGNYWIKNTADAGLKGGEAWTDDCSAPEDFAKRTSHMISGTEAQWFFDSWLSFAAGQLKGHFQPGEKQHEALHAKQLHYLHRSLGQITGDSLSGPEIGGDLKPTAPWSCPESYNTVLLKDGVLRYAPSPITPLNWAKASLRLALKAME